MVRVSFFFVLFVAFSFGCYNGDFYLATQDGQIYQANLDATINTKYLSTECVLENGFAKTDNSVLLSCYLEDDTAILTISENKVENTAVYDHDSFDFCTLNPITFGGNGIVWGSYSEIYLKNETHGYIEGYVVSVKQSTGEILEKTTFTWREFGGDSSIKDSDNGTCLFNVGQYYSFIDGDILYTTSSSTIAAFNVSTTRAVLLSITNLLESGENLDSMAYDSKHRMLYAVAQNDLYRFSVAHNMTYEVLNSSLPISNDYVTSMDSSNSYFVMLLDPTDDMRMLIYNIEEDSFEIKSVDAKLDVRSMIGYSYTDCASSDSSNTKRIVEIVVPVVIGSIMIITIVAFLIYRRKRRNYQPIDK